MMCVIYLYTVAHSHSIVHWTGRFYCLLPAVCSLHHRCRSLQSCRLYWKDCAEHLWEYQDHHNQWLQQGRHSNKYMYLNMTCNREWHSFSNMPMERTINIYSIHAHPNHWPNPHSNILYIGQDTDVDCYI